MATRFSMWSGVFVVESFWGAMGGLQRRTLSLISLTLKCAATLINLKSTEQQQGWPHQELIET